MLGFALKIAIRMIRWFLLNDVSKYLAMISSGFHPVQRDWSAYYDAIAGRPPRATLLRTLDLFDTELAPEHPKTAVDLGCGDGRDTVELLRRNWHVLAIDSEETAIARLLSRPDLRLERLHTQIERFECLTLPTIADLINASFCLPFCDPSAFPSFWQTLVAALRPGGRFCGQFLGDRDSWVTQMTVTAHSRDQVAALFVDFEVEWFEEEEHPGKTAIGEDKYWHLFHIIARKRASG